MKPEQTMNKLIAHIVKKLSGVDIAHLQDEKDALLTKNIQLTYDIKEAQAEISYRRNQWAETHEALEKAKAEIAALQDTIAQLKKERDGKQNDLFSTQPDSTPAPEQTETEETPQQTAPETDTPQPETQETQTTPQKEAAEEEPQKDTEDTPTPTIEQQIDRIRHSAPYLRITLREGHTQLIFDTEHISLKTGLFEQGVEGPEIVEERIRFAAYEDIEEATPMNSPFSGEAVECNFFAGGNGIQITETLIDAVCGYHPIHIAYKEKNGHTTEHNIRYLCFKPTDKKITRLPHSTLFADIMSGNVDATRLIGLYEHSGNIRTVPVNNIQRIQVFDAYVTDAQGAHTQTQELYNALLDNQPEMAETIYRCMPDAIRNKPDTIRRRAHSLVMEDNEEDALRLYRSFPPETVTDSGHTWQELILSEIEELIAQDIATTQFNNIKQTLDHAHT